MQNSTLFGSTDILLLTLVALKRAQEEEHLDIVFVNERLIFQEKNLIR